VHPSLKLGFHLVQFRLQPFADRLPQYRKPPIAPLLHADVRYVQQACKDVEITVQPYKYATADGRNAEDLLLDKQVATVHKQCIYESVILLAKQVLSQLSCTPPPTI